MTLQYGAQWLVPDDAPAAWGARIIVSQDGLVDIVWDRTDLEGPRKKDLVNKLESNFPMDMLRQVIRSKLLAGEITTNGAIDLVLFEDDELCVAGNTNGSCGYFYVAAWLKK